MAASPSWSRELDDVDNLSAELMLQLHLQDIAELSSTVSASERAALQLYQDHINLYRAIRAAVEGEETELADISAAALSGANAETASAPVDLEPTAEEDPGEPIPTFECVTCNDNFDGMHSCAVPCGHHYCDQDLEALFRAAMIDQSLYPPRCCRQNIPFDDVRHFLSNEVVQDFEAKKEELDDPKPTYCHVKACSAYIGHDGKTETKAACPKCSAQTCVLCKAEHHTGDCTLDEATEETLTLAEREGWRRCPNCGRMVELRIGCYHITHVRSIPNAPELS